MRSILLPLTALAALASPAAAAPILNSGNGHYYEFIASSASWTEALAAAAAAAPVAGQVSYLATLTSAAESQFVFDNVRQGGFWISGTDATTEGTFVWAAGPEIGQVFYGPGAGSAYHNFAVPSEPNNNPCCDPAGEDYVHTFNGSQLWNDLADNNLGATGVAGYLVEYSLGPEVPEPAAWAMMIIGFGLAGGMMRQRKTSPAHG